MAVNSFIAGATPFPDFAVPDNLYGDVAPARMQELVQSARGYQILLSIILNGDSRLSGFTFSAYWKSHVYFMRQWVRTLFPNLTLGSGFDGCYFEVDGVAGHDIQFGYFPDGKTTWSKYNWLDCVGRKGYKCLNTVSERFVIPFDPAVNASATPATPFGAARYLEIFTMGTAKDGSGVKTGNGGRFTWSIYQSADGTTAANIAGGTAPLVGDATNRIATGTISTNANMGDGGGVFWSGTRSGILNAATALDKTKPAILVIYPDTTNAGGGSFTIEGFNSYCDEVTIAAGKVTKKQGIQVHHVARTGSTAKWAQGWLGLTNLPNGPEWQPSGPEGWTRPFCSDSCTQNPTVPLLPEFDAGIMIGNHDINDVLNTDSSSMNLAAWKSRVGAIAHECERHNCLYLHVSEPVGRGTLGLDTSWTYAAAGTVAGNKNDWDGAIISTMNASPQNKRTMAMLDWSACKGGGDYTAVNGVQGDGQNDCIHAAETDVPKKMGAIIGVLEGGSRMAAANGIGMARKVGPQAAPGPVSPFLWFDSSRQDSLRVSSDGTQVPTNVELGLKYPYWKDLSPNAKVAVQAGAAGIIPTLDCIGKAIGLRFNSQQIGFTGASFYDFNNGWALHMVVTAYDVSNFPHVILKSNNGNRDINLGVDGSFQCIQATSNGVTANVSGGKLFGAPQVPSITLGVKQVIRWIYRAGDKVLRFRRGPVGSTSSLDALTYGEWTIANVGFQTQASGAGLMGTMIGNTAGANFVVHEYLFSIGDVSDAQDAAILVAWNRKWKAN